MNLRHMEVFHAIMIAGSATAAARMLDVSQPAISAMLSQCEAQLGFKLFERMQGRLYPTTQAQAIYPDIANIFQRVETVSRMTVDFAAGRQGSVSVAATFSIANGPLAAAAAAFTKERPDIQISIEALPTSKVADQVARRAVDFGLGFGDVLDPAVKTEVLARAEIACIMLADHPLASRSEVNIADLLEYNIISPGPDTALGRAVEQAFETAKVKSTRRIKVNYSSTAAVMAARGAGVALIEPFRWSWTLVAPLVARPLRPIVPLEATVMESIGYSRTRASQHLLDLIKEEVQRGDRV